MSRYIPPPSTLPAGSRVWAYLRDSGGEGQELSTDQQRETVEEYCEEYGLQLVEVFEDKARSGGKTAGRYAFQRMIDSSGDPYRADGLLVWNYARFARNADDSIYYKSTLRRLGMVVYSLTDQIPEGEIKPLVETIQDFGNQKFKDQISRDVKRAHRIYFSQGFSFGVPPRGFVIQHEKVSVKRNGHERIMGRWVADPELADLVRQAFELRAEGQSYSRIVAATDGKIYNSVNSWCTFFRNKAYLGIGVWGELEIPNHHPALVSRELWDAVQVIQAETRRPTQGPRHPRYVASSALFSGIAYCIHCGSAMIKNRTGKNDWDFYICGQKDRHGYKACVGRMVNSKRAEQVIVDAVLEQVLTPDFVMALLAEVREELSGPRNLDQRAAEIRKGLGAVERATNHLLELVEKAGPVDAYLERLGQKQAERGQLLKALHELEARRAAGMLEVTPEALGLVLQAWRGRIADLEGQADRRPLKDFLRRFVSRIELGYNTARIYYGYPINALKITTDEQSPALGALTKTVVTSRALFVSWE